MESDIDKKLRLIAVSPIEIQNKVPIQDKFIINSQEIVKNKNLTAEPAVDNYKTALKFQSVFTEESVSCF